MTNVHAKDIQDQIDAGAYCEELGSNHVTGAALFALLVDRGTPQEAYTFALQTNGATIWGDAITDEICEELNLGCGTVREYRTGEQIQKARASDAMASFVAGLADQGRGVFNHAGVPCYVG